VIEVEKGVCCSHWHHSDNDIPLLTVHRGNPRISSTLHPIAA
jgi:hypothetical protein